jgi:[protein-PII] uridylyltransferase
MALRRGLENPIDKEERIREIKSHAVNLLDNRLRASFNIDAIWSQLGDDYFIHHSPDEIAWHTQAITRSSENELPLILIREMTARGGSEIFIYMRDHANIFSRATRTLDLLNLNILDARIITSTSGYTLDTFIVLEENALLHDNLLDFDKPIKTVSRLKSRRLKNFPIPTRVSFSQDEKNARTIMEVTATDRSGFLSAIGSALEKCKTSLQSAKIATYGERIEDIFFITDQDNHMIKDEHRFQELRDAITEALK